jgi:hypothetical protein
MLLVSSVQAGQFGGETAADFLKIGIGARSAGMGGAYTAVADGATASFWNPANLSRSERGEVSLGHQAWLQDIALEYGAVSFNLNEDWDANAAIIYMGYGDIPGYDNDGLSTGSLSAYDMMISASGAYRISDQFSAGLTFKVINQKLDQVSASTVAGDLGVQFTEGIWRAGLVFANIGGQMTYESVSESLPSEFRLGLAARPFATTDLILATDFAKQFKGGYKLANGFQVGFENQYYLRGGWEYKQNGIDADWQSTYSTGAGILYNQYSLDYSYTIGNHLTEEDLHRFSFGYSFD